MRIDRSELQPFAAFKEDKIEQLREVILKVIAYEGEESKIYASGIPDKYKVKNIST